MPSRWPWSNGRAMEPLTEPATIAQRIVRGKAKIRSAAIPYHVPALAELPERLESVLDVVYLVFNEGYSASSGSSLTRVELSAEAIRFDGASRHVADGPFAETNELVAGFWLWNVRVMGEAIGWVKRCPNPMLEVSEIEIRPVFGPEDFGEAYTPELREREARLAERIQTPNPAYFLGDSPCRSPSFSPTSSSAVAAKRRSSSTAPPSAPRSKR